MGRQKGKLTKKHGLIVRRMLEGKTLRDIAPEIGVTFQRVGQIWQRVAPTLNEKTMQRIRLAGIDRRTPPPIRQRAVDAFFRVLSKSPHGYGVMSDTAKHLGLVFTTVRRHLALGGVNPVGEIHRRRLQFVLAISQMDNLTEKEIAKKLRVTRGTVNKYKHLIAAGKHLQGALEMVERPEAHFWWDIKLPSVSGNYPNQGRIDLGRRNKTLESDLSTFNDAIKEARSEMVKWHPDKPENRNEDAKKLFDRAAIHWHKLRRGQATYIHREKAFRKKYGLPIHILLE